MQRQIEENEQHPTVETHIGAAFAAVAERYADNVAVTEYGGGSVTYAELNRRANRVAHGVTATGVRAGEAVASTLPQGVGAMVGLLGILKAGGAYVYLDSDLPENQLLEQIEVAVVRCIVVDADGVALAERLAAGADVRVLNVDALAADLPETTLNVEIPPSSPANIVFTSGSTGKPKVIPRSHRATLKDVYNYNLVMPLHPDDRMLMVQLLAFGGTYRSLYCALLSGSALYLLDVRRFTLLDAARWVQAAGLTVFRATPTLFRSIIESADGDAFFESVRLINMGGEPLTRHDVDLMRRHFPASVELLHNIGTSETGGVGAVMIDPEKLTSEVVPAGYPMPGKTVLIWDENRQPVPQGEVGEIVIHSRYLADGYLNEPELTAEKFLPDPDDPLARFYLTGDLGWQDADGLLFHMGRKDRQVKIRGQRVETAGVESYLHRLDAVKRAAVRAFSVDDKTDEKMLVGYVVPTDPTAPPTSAWLTEALAAVMPAYMIPTRFVLLDDLPRTATGKVDYKQLPEPDAPEPTDAVTPPRTPLEAQVAALFADVLRLEAVDVEADFFRLGGNSLRAMRVLAGVQAAHGVQLTLATFHNLPGSEGVCSAAHLARYVYGQLAGDDTAASLTDRAERERKLLDGLVVGRVIPQTDAPNPHPTLPMQQMMWMQSQLFPDKALYVVDNGFRLRGDLDLDALRGALQTLVDRHEPLRTTFALADDGRLMQTVNAPRPVDLRVVEGVDDTERVIRRFLHERFDLSSDQLFVALLVKEAPDLHHLVTKTHHIVSDNWSGRRRQHELFSAYAALAVGKPVDLPDVPLRYVDYARWWHANNPPDTHAERTQQALAALDEVNPVQLPTDKPRPPAAAYRVERFVREVTPSLQNAVMALSHRLNATPFVVLMAVFNLLVARVAGQRAFILGVPSANRNLQEVENLIGLLSDMLTLKVELRADDTLYDLCQRLQESILAQMGDDQLSYPLLARALHAHRGGFQNGLYTVMFNDVRKAWTGVSVAGLDVEVMTGAKLTHSELELAVYVYDEDDALSVEFEYATELFDAATVERFADRYLTLLERVAANPAQPLHDLDMLTDAEREQIFRWNDTARDVPSVSYVAQFEARAAQTPDAVALRSGDERVTYAQLNAMANRVAHGLAVVGVQAGQLVGLHMGRSVDFVAAMLGVWKAGAAFLPLDMNLNEARRRDLVADAGVVALLHGDAPFVVDGLPSLDVREMDNFPATNPDLPTDLDAPAYALYTSGSTGEPKAALLPHRQVVNRVAWELRAYPFTQGEVVVNRAAPIFVDTLAEVLVPLLGDAEVLIVPDEVFKQPARLVDLMAAHGVTRTMIPPAYLRVLLDTLPDLAGRLPDLRFWVNTGEALSGDLARRFREAMPHATLYNIYGLTELWDVSWYVPDDAHNGNENAPIGKPIDNVQAWVRDDRGKVCPVGVPGTLYVGGMGVAMGYINRPALTEQRFVADPFTDDPAARLYNTGDVVRWLPDGNLEYIGRADRQVKIRGYRVELAGVEHALAALDDVELSAAVAVQNALGSNDLVAYVTLTAGSQADGRDIKAALAERLPPTSMPSQVVVLDAMPLTSSGKINRRALPKPDRAQLGVVDGYAAPQSDDERALAEIWRRLLNVERVGRGDDFFLLGGDSLRAMHMLAQVEAKTGKELPFGKFAADATLAGAAAALEAPALLPETTHAERSLVVALQPHGDQPPIFMLHGIGGGVINYRTVSSLFPDDTPFYALRAPRLENYEKRYQNVETLAATYIDAMEAVHPQGPYTLAGFCFGGIIAYEVARQLEARGQRPPLLLLIDPPTLNLAQRVGVVAQLEGRFWQNWERVEYHLLSGHADGSVVERARRWLDKRRTTQPETVSVNGAAQQKADRAAISAQELLHYQIPPRYRGLPAATQRYIFHGIKLMRRYHLQMDYSGDTVLLVTNQGRTLKNRLGWRGLTGGKLDFVSFEGDHNDIFRMPDAERLAPVLLEIMSRVGKQ